MADTALVVDERTQDVAVQGESSAIMSLIERAARDESVDIDKMERLFDMHERMTARHAKEAFHTALAEMQTELPEITKRGETRDKEKNLMYSYAKWEDINREIKPVLSRFGFGLSFRIEPDQTGLKITAILSRCGHTEETSIIQSLDMGGAKMNANQARGAATSYGKRYTAGALLNLISYDEQDTDAASSMSGDTLTEDQLKQIRDGMQQLGQGDEAILAWAGPRGWGATELENVPIEAFDKMMGQINHWIKVREKANA